MRLPVGILALLMAGTIHQSIAQSYRIEPPRLAVKWSPIHLINFYPSIQIGLEHKLFRNITMQYELGAIIDMGVMSNDDFIDQRGFRAIGEVRYYLPSPPKIPFYIAGEYYYGDIRFDRSDVIGYNCQGGECLYFEYITHRVNHRHQGVGLKYGILLFPGWNKNRKFFFDLNVGAAYRSIRYNYPELPDGNDITRFEQKSDDHIFRPEENKGRHVRPVVGLRMSYVIM